MPSKLSRNFCLFMVDFSGWLKLYSKVSLANFSLFCSVIHKRSPPEEIKKAYYNCMKACHPDLSGNDPETTNFCMFINEVYAVLSDPVQRMIYDEIHGCALTAINPFLDDSCLKDLAFVDEFSCIGCKNCANVAPDVFSIEEDFGRARVYNQGGDPELVQQAIDSCPVDCIHWTSAPQLSLLEDEMRRVERVNVAMMLSRMNISAVDVFRMASSRWQKRQAKVLLSSVLKTNSSLVPLFLPLCIGLKDREEGDLGPVYGFQWRHFSARLVDLYIILLI
ncbi:hypothetical protein UlMin_025244 [Ulmus minor]